MFVANIKNKDCTECQQKMQAMTFCTETKTAINDFIHRASARIIFICSTHFTPDSF